MFHHKRAISFLFFVFLIGLSASAASRYDDDFNGDALGPQWLRWSTQVQVRDGYATISGLDNEFRPLTLAFGPARLTGPWSVETQVRIPSSGSFRVGLSLRLTSPAGLESVVGVARPSGGEPGLVLLSGTHSANVTASAWKVPPELANAPQLILRLESVGAELSRVRCGARLPSSSSAWIWSEPQKLDPPPVYLENVQLASWPALAAAAKPVQVSFDYLRCEGPIFAPNSIPSHALELLQRAAKMHPFDLETRAELALHAMSNVLDPIGGAPFIFAWLSPPFRFETPVPALAGEYVDGLAMARIISGTEGALAVEALMRRISQDVMVDGFNWGKTSAGLDIAGHKHSLPGLLTLYRLNPQDRRPLEIVRESLRAFHRIALRGKLPDGRPYLYFPVADRAAHSSEYSFVSYHRTEGWQGRTREPIETGSAGFTGTITLPFAQYFELTRDPEAAEFLDQFIRFLLERATDFNPDGSFTKHEDVTNGQVWSRMMTMEGILIYGLASGRSDLVDWARRAFDQARRLHGTRFGWLPENLNFNHGLGCETDTMTAQTEIAFLLARKVDDYYWEEAERIAMNQLMAQQLVRVDFLGGPTPEEARRLNDSPAYLQQQRLALNVERLAIHSELKTEKDFEQIPLRLLGGFASFCAPHEWDNLKPAQKLGPNYLTMSSNGSGMRALYNVWYHAARWENGADDLTLRVNLHWSKNLPGAQIISYLPSQTRLEIKLQRASSVVVRKPDWAPMEQIHARIISGDDESPNPIMIRQRGRWLNLGRFGQKTHLLIEFPDQIITHRDVIYTRSPGSGYYGPLPAGSGKTKWGQAFFTTQWRGNAVVAMEPKGEHQSNYEGREKIGPYIPRYTATLALDPIAMTPLDKTGEPRNK